MENDKMYYLVIKRNNKDYLYVDWTQTKSYQGEDMYSLYGIDSYTSHLNRIELLLDLVNSNLLESKEIFDSFQIIFKEKNRQRELKEGPIFIEDTNILSENSFLEFIFKNKNNKALINNISNLINEENLDIKTNNFKELLKNINKYKNDNELIKHLEEFRNIPYHMKRQIIMRTSQKILPKLANYN